METPQIHDILPLPQFALVPTLNMWLGLCAAALLLILLFRLSQRKVFDMRAFEIGFQELRALESTTIDKQTLSRIALLCKRLIGLLVSKELTHFTSAELQNFVRNHSGLEGTLLTLKQFDELRYKPNQENIEESVRLGMRVVLTELASYREKLEGGKE